MTEVRIAVRETGERAHPDPARPAVLPSDQDASGRSLGDEELARLAAVVRSGTLTGTKGSQVPELESAVAARLGVPFAIACASGTAAVHTAVATVDPEPGDEIVTTPVTDMGALAPILYQGAIPVFADVDPRTGNVTAATIEACLSARTRAVVVTHLFGTPCAMAPIMALAAARSIPVIEDCAQAYLARAAGRLVGTFGALGCFSTQQGKHMTTGEGGIVVGTDPAWERRARMFVNKAWPYGEADPDHEFLALNSRMSELQAAVANAQLDKLEDGVRRRRASAAALTGALREVRGLHPPVVDPADEPSWWRYPLRVDREVVPGGPDAVAAALRPLGVPAAPRYIRKPAFRTRVFAEQRTFGSSRWPFTLARPEAVDYSAARFPGTFRFLEDVLVLPWNERYEPDHVEQIATALTLAVERASVPS
jgi:dTDP-4-amino-4,6-dideoxygalactose transaminase